MAYVRANDVEFHVQRLVPGPGHEVNQARQTVVYVHGLVIDNMSSFFYTLANPIVQAGTEVILYDLRGHGLSERPHSGYALEDTLADLDALLDALDIDDPVHVVGNSYGGTVALGFAVAHPERVASAVLIDAHYSVEGLDLVDTMPRDEEIQRWLADDAAGRKLAALGRAVDALTSQTTFAEDMRASAARSWGREQLQSISCPVLAIYGEHSDIIDRATHLPDLIPDCRVTILPGCSHFVILEGRGALRDQVLLWLAAQRSRSPYPSTMAGVPAR